MIDIKFVIDLTVKPQYGDVNVVHLDNSTGDVNKMLWCCCR